MPSPGGVAQASGFLTSSRYKPRTFTSFIVGTVGYSLVGIVRLSSVQCAFARETTAVPFHHTMSCSISSNGQMLFTENEH